MLFHTSFMPLPNATDDERLNFFSSIKNPPSRSLLALIQYFQQHKKHFDRMNVVMTYEPNILWLNGTWDGIVKRINNSEIDIGVVPITIDEFTTDAVDFSYPYKLDDCTFISRKHKPYKPHISI